MEPPQCSLQQRGSSGNVAAVEMMEGCGHLDQCLQKTFVRLVQGEPHTLPMLVSCKELASLIAGESFGKRSAIPVNRHAFSLCDSAVPR